jgi:hypothetical protein
MVACTFVVVACFARPHHAKKGTRTLRSTRAPPKGVDLYDSLVEQVLSQKKHFLGEIGIGSLRQPVAQNKLIRAAKYLMRTWKSP